MSGDVQPRKRKDKKKKKDDLGIEEPRGTAAALGEGDVFIHSYQDHGTGGHWCAKIIFFSLLAVLITLIGLIILENRGLTELEANSVESRYSGVLEGWLEDTPDDDHHDEHTLELKHPDDDDTEEHIDSEHEDIDDKQHDIDEDESHEEDEEHDIDEDEEHEIDENEENEESDDEEGEDDENEENDNESMENFEESDEEEIDEEIVYNQYQYDEEKYNIEENDEDQISQEIEEENNLSNEIDDNDDQNEDDESDEDARDDEDENEIDDENNKYDEIKQDDSLENNNEETEEQNNDDFESDEEIEHIEREVDNNEDLEEPLTTQYSKQDEDVSKEDDTQEEDAGDEDYLQADDDEPPVERIATPPAGKPFIEIEEEVTEKPIDTLAEEEEYERKQEELRREEAQASHVWLKLAVGGALLVATHAVLRRATAPRDAPEIEEPAREDSPPMTDRRMTIVSEEFTTNVPQERSPPSTQRQEIEEEIFKKPAPVIKSIPLQKSDNEREAKTSDVKKVPDERDEEEKELYSDEEEIEEEEKEDVLPMTSQQKLPEHKSPVPEQKDEESEPEVPDDVEIIDDEQIEEEEEEDDEEEEISDVDDTELLSRLEAKYGRLPEQERPGKHKDGGNSIEDEWPGEPSESYWRQQLDIAEDELRQDWPV